MEFVDQISQPEMFAQTSRDSTELLVGNDNPHAKFVVAGNDPSHF
jgi:hypothetical protein